MRVIAPVAALTLVAALVGWQQSIASAAPSATGPINDQLAVQVAPTGQYDFGAAPDTSTGVAGPGSFDLSYNWPDTPYTSFATLQSDGVNTLLNTPTAGPMDSTDRLSNDTIYTAGDIAVTQELSIVANPFSGKNDLAKLAYTVTNGDTAPHTAGVRVMIDTDIAGGGGTFNVPGTGTVSTETDFTGGGVPDYIEALGGPSTPADLGLAVLSGSGATTPDRVALTQWQSIADTLWDYQTTPGQALGDSAYAVWFNPTQLAAGASRTYVTYYGVGDSSDGSTTTSSPSTTTTTEPGTSTTTDPDATTTTTEPGTTTTTTTTPGTTTTTEPGTTTTTVPGTTTTTTLPGSTTTTTTPNGGGGGNGHHHHRRHHRRHRRHGHRNPFDGFGWFGGRGGRSHDSGHGFGSFF